MASHHPELRFQGVGSEELTPTEVMRVGVLKHLCQIQKQVIRVFLNKSNITLVIVYNILQKWY